MYLKFLIIDVLYDILVQTNYSCSECVPKKTPYLSAELPQNKAKNKKWMPFKGLSNDSDLNGWFENSLQVKISQIFILRLRA